MLTGPMAAWSCWNVLLGQQAHEVGGGVGVQSQRRHGDIGGRMGPVLVVVVQACQCGMCGGGLSQHHLPWKKKGQNCNLEATEPKRSLAEPLI